jgi:hypothetical protein
MTEKLNLYEITYVIRRPPPPPSQIKTSLWASSPSEAWRIFLSARDEYWRDHYRRISCEHSADVQKLYEEQHGAQ